MLENFDYGMFFPKLDESEKKNQPEVDSVLEDYLGDWGDDLEEKNVKLKKK